MKKLNKTSRPTLKSISVEIEAGEPVKKMVSFFQRMELIVNSPWFFVSIVAIIIIPPVLYFIQFHNGLSGNESSWEVFGSYMGGVIGPLLTFFTVVILILSLKREMMNKEESAKKDNESDFKDMAFRLIELVNIQNQSVQYTNKSGKLFVGLAAYNQVKEWLKTSELLYNHDEVYDRLFAKDTTGSLRCEVIEFVDIYKEQRLAFNHVIHTILNGYTFFKHNKDDKNYTFLFDLWDNQIPLEVKYCITVLFYKELTDSDLSLKDSRFDVFASIHYIGIRLNHIFDLENKWEMEDEEA